MQRPQQRGVSENHDKWRNSAGAALHLKAGHRHDAPKLKNESRLKNIKSIENILRQKPNLHEQDGARGWRDAGGVANQVIKITRGGAGHFSAVLARRNEKHVRITPDFRSVATHADYSRSQCESVSCARDAVGRADAVTMYTAHLSRELREILRICSQRKQDRRRYRRKSKCYFSAVHPEESNSPTHRRKVPQLV